MTIWDAADPRFIPMLTVARRLDDLSDDAMFLGGAVVPLLITDPGAESTRPTKDVDLIIEVTTRIGYYELGDRLRELGFSEDDTGGPICRWIIDEIEVDIMPTEAHVLGYTSSWFSAAIRDASTCAFTDGQVIRVASPPYFCATKLEAFRDRGANDYVMSHDMEDIMAVVDGRDELFAELAAAEPSVRSYVAFTIRSFLAFSSFIDALPGYLPGDAASQARLPILVERLRRLARLC